MIAGKVHDVRRGSSQRRKTMDFNKLNYLLAVAEFKSFSKAAEKCFISQPALTRCIKNIERDLGVDLFDRSHSPIQLTYAGERYISGMQEIQAKKAQLDEEMEQIAQEKKKRLKIGIPMTRSATWLKRILPAFQRCYPNVDLQIIEGNLYMLQVNLQKSLLDLCLMVTDPIFIKGIELIPFYEEQMMLVVSRQAKALAGISLPENQMGILHYLPPDILEKIPFISSSSSQGAYFFARRIFDEMSINPQTVMELVNSSATYQVAPGNGGFAFAPITASYEERFHPVPLFCSPSPAPINRTIGIMCMKDPVMSPIAKEFIRIAKEQVCMFANQNIPPFKIVHDLKF